MIHIPTYDDMAEAQWPDSEKWMWVFNTFYLNAFDSNAFDDYEHEGRQMEINAIDAGSYL